MLKNVGVHRMSISLPPEVADVVRRAAARAGVSVSTWLADAAVERAEHEAALVDGRAAIAEYEAEDGPLPQKLRSEARTALADLGLLRDPASGRRPE